MDCLEAQLIKLEEGLKQAWHDADDPTSPLGELAALAAAIRVLYHELHRGSEGTSAARDPSDTED